MKNIPTFKTPDGKYIYGRELVESLLAALYKDKDHIIWEGEKITMDKQLKSKDGWIVIVRRESDV